jgi:hypothetical protein
MLLGKPPQHNGLGGYRSKPTRDELLPGTIEQENGAARGNSLEPERRTANVLRGREEKIKTKNDEKMFNMRKAGS